MFDNSESLFSRAIVERFCMSTFLVIAFFTFVANVVGAVSGFGIATIMLPILITLIPTNQAILIVTIIHWFNDLWKLLLFRRGIDWSLLLWFGFPSVIASIFGALLIMHIPLALFHRLLGLFLISYVIFLWWFPDFEIHPSPKTAVLGGVLSGFSAGFFGIRGAIKSSFLIAYDLSKQVYLATMGALALIVDSTRLTTYLWSGMALTSENLLGLAFYVPLSFLGAYAGSLIVHKVSQLQFRAMVAVFIGIMGLKLFLGW